MFWGLIRFSYFEACFISFLFYSSMSILFMSITCNYLTFFTIYFEKKNLYTGVESGMQTPCGEAIGDWPIYSIGLQQE